MVFLSHRFPTCARASEFGRTCTFIYSASRSAWSLLDVARLDVLPPCRNIQHTISAPSICSLTSPVRSAVNSLARSRGQIPHPYRSNGPVRQPSLGSFLHVVLSPPPSLSLNILWLPHIYLLSNDPTRQRPLPSPLSGVLLNLCMMYSKIAIVSMEYTRSPLIRQFKGNNIAHSLDRTGLLQSYLSYLIKSKPCRFIPRNRRQAHLPRYLLRQTTITIPIRRRHMRTARHDLLGATV
ncbi:hypothetical protein NEOLEDRAFT_1141630 [Neolentinus lepideus HHB14362 ss-1]|uniref:Uncharacterized protein n=1 Tax=Neolentinus lepideus HHB14362 ss-1 TaxID=1314782 RepID=A0A165NJY3_9AGAM|nr:hypothetical protein NEOLEDRAFT_1141630 [Neolentinus lepideus HHB14362 ss-1]